jgi:hypothetical protein
MEFRALIIQACNEVTVDICHQVINIITVRFEEVARCNCGHIEHYFHRGLLTMKWSFFLFMSL